eukprot:scaffold14447_cov122-Isochrysis_galbana.AAC.1
MLKVAGGVGVTLGREVCGPGGEHARVTMAVSDTRRGGARLRGGPPKGSPHTSQPMLRVAEGVGATLGREVCAPGGERACGGERAHGGERGGPHEWGGCTLGR